MERTRNTVLHKNNNAGDVPLGVSIFNKSIGSNTPAGQSGGDCQGAACESIEDNDLRVINDFEAQYSANGFTKDQYDLLSAFMRFQQGKSLLYETVSIEEEVDPEQFSTEVNNFFKLHDQYYDDYSDNIEQDILVGNVSWIVDKLDSMISSGMLNDSDSAKAKEMLNRLNIETVDETEDSDIEDYSPEENSDDFIDESLLRMINQTLQESKRLVSQSPKLNEVIDFEYNGDIF